METKTLKVNGMTCQMCVKHVTRALEGVEGVAHVEVKLEPGVAQVTYDPAVTGMSTFREVVAEAGYELADVIV